MTATVAEARMLARLAKETGVTTQMGNQGHSSDDARLINEWIHAGVIGDVREVHVWTNRPIWPQGIPAPIAPEQMPDKTDWGRGSLDRRLASAVDGRYEQPPALDWKNWRAPSPAAIATATLAIQVASPCTAELSRYQGASAMNTSTQVPVRTRKRGVSRTGPRLPRGP